MQIDKSREKTKQMVLRLNNSLLILWISKINWNNWKTNRMALKIWKLILENEDTKSLLSSGDEDARMLLMVENIINALTENWK